MKYRPFPCPFCGEPDLVKCPKGYYLECAKAGEGQILDHSFSSSYPHRTERDAVLAWNREMSKLTAHLQGQQIEWFDLQEQPHAHVDCRVMGTCDLCAHFDWDSGDTTDAYHVCKDRGLFVKRTDPRCAAFIPDGVVPTQKISQGEKIC